VRKIPTLFKRDPEDMRRVLNEVHPDCQWVLDGEGVATRKYDGTCVGFFPAVRGGVRVHAPVGSHEVNEPDDLAGVWLARREVKPGKNPPPGFIAEQADEITGKTVGWEPIGQSSFIKPFTEALEALGAEPYFGTYELIGPKINGNPEDVGRHALIRHHDADPINLPPTLDFRTCQRAVTDLAEHGFEGIVWHHADGRMAKLKGRDFPAS
jgi:hypothetical protein